MTCILIVDDDTNNQRILSFTLRKSGYTVRVASDGVEGLASLAESFSEGSSSPCDLVIIDLAMPRMDGLTMLTRLRALPASRSIPVIMLTASGDDQMREAVESVGISAFLTKPSSSRTLLQLIRQFIGEANASSPSESDPRTADSGQRTAPQ